MCCTFTNIKVNRGSPILAYGTRISASTSGAGKLYLSLPPHVIQVACDDFTICRALLFDINKCMLGRYSIYTWTWNVNVKREREKSNKRFSIVCISYRRERDVNVKRKFMICDCVTRAWNRSLHVAIFSSPEHKVLKWAFVILQCPASVVRPCVRPSVCQQFL